jgi:hypothetical protein
VRDLTDAEKAERDQKFKDAIAKYDKKQAEPKPTLPFMLADFLIDASEHDVARVIVKFGRR